MPPTLQAAPPIACCQFCGAEVPADVDQCPKCGRWLSGQSAKITVVVTILVIFGGFALTHYFVNLHRATELSLANRWFTRGEQAMQAHLPKVAADDYRTALNYDEENRQYRLRLAQALLADNRLAEARAHLISLWEEGPADGEVNLTLGRVENRRGNYAETVRYYNDAINGVWEGDPRERRTAARFELARYLMQKQKLAEARAELLATLADSPTEPADLLQLGKLLLQLNEPAHALQAYSALLAKESNNAQAWLGEGQAFLDLGQSTDAERATAKAVEYDPNLDDARQQLEIVREILRLNPSMRGLPLAERANRVTTAFGAALARLSSCASQLNIDLAAPLGTAPGVNEPGSTPTTESNAAAPAPNTLELLYTSGLEKQPDATQRALVKNPDALEPTMQYVFEVERATASICPRLSTTDRALLLLAQHESETAK
jgi:tetratricopeptide (TPR) repeat protein